MIVNRPVKRCTYSITNLEFQLILLEISKFFENGKSN